MHVALGRGTHPEAQGTVSLISIKSTGAEVEGLRDGHRDLATANDLKSARQRFVAGAVDPEISLTTARAEDRPRSLTARPPSPSPEYSACRVEAPIFKYCCARRYNLKE